MKKLYITLGVIIVIIVVVLVIIFTPKHPTGKPDANFHNASGTTTATDRSYKDISYTIDGEVVKLNNGSASSPVGTESGLEMDTQYFGNDVFGDLNGDGKPDVAFILTQSGGGTGTFVYVVAALKTDTGYKGTNGIDLGDRISPKSLEIKNGVLIVKYLDRNENDPMSADPTVPVTKNIKVKDGQLIEIK